MRTCKYTAAAVFFAAYFAYLFFLSIVSGCSYYASEDQVQVVKSIADFKPFTAIPRNIAYGPYCLKVTTGTAIIAWEEKTWGKDLRHVEVSITGLLPATEYFYRVNGEEKDGRLVTAPVDDSSFSFLILGDTQTDAAVSKRIADKMLETGPDASFALHMGDLVENGAQLESWEKEWWQPMSDLLLHLPVYPAMGNHDGGSAYFQTYFGSLGDNGTYYSFDWGGAHFIVLYINNAVHENDEQITWLKQNLEENRGADFTVVCNHAPVYFSSTAEAGETTPMQDILVPLYEQYGVSLVLSGDLHGYQHQVKNNIHYVISAGGGGKLYDYGLPLEGMTLQLYKAHNFSQCLIEGKTMRFTTYDIEGNILESFEIAKDVPVDIQSKIVVESDTAAVMSGEQFRVDLFVKNGEGIDNASIALECFKDEPPVHLTVIDAEPDRKGAQIEKGALGGEVIVNELDNSTGTITYTEKNISLLSNAETKIASVTFAVPQDARATALYLVPKVMFIDTAGKALPCFMGGVKVIIKKN